jgi:exonuclease III
LRTEWDTIKQYIESEQWDVVLLTETHMREGAKAVNLQGYQSFLKCRPKASKKGGGVGVWTKNTLPVIQWSSPAGDDMLQAEKLWLVVNSGQCETAVCVVYMATEVPSAEEWNDLLEQELHADIQYHLDAHREILVVGDFNGHIAMPAGKLSGVYEASNRNGKRIESLTHSHNLTILNNHQDKCKGKWTWCRGAQRSIVDYALASRNIALRTQSLIIDEEGQWDLGSDHNWLVLSCNMYIPTRGTANPQQDNPNVNLGGKWKINDNTSWPKYRRMMRPNLQAWIHDAAHSHDYDEHMLEIGYKSLEKCIVDAASMAIGKIGGTNTRRNNKAKKSKRLRRALKSRRKMAVRWKRAVVTQHLRVQERWDDYKAAKKKVKVAQTRSDGKFRRKRRQSLLASGGFSSRSFWRELKDEKKKSVSALKIEGELVTDTERIKAEIRKYWQQLGKDGRTATTPPTDSHQSSDLLQAAEDSFAEPITQSEVEAVLKNLKPGTSAGPDSIPYELLKNGGKWLAQCLATLFETCRSREWVPTAWSEEDLVILHKKSDPMNLDNYRGLALGNTMAKLYAKIIHQRLAQTVEEQDWLGEIQPAFRKKRGTTDNLFILNSLVERARKQNRALFLIFVDLRKAFDTVRRDRLWMAMSRLGLGGKPMRLIQSLYKNHRRKLRGDTAFTMQCDIGVRQGCVLSPLLFTILLIELGKRLLAQGHGVPVDGITIPGLFFADDIVLMAEKESLLMKLMAEVVSFSEEEGLSINWNKTKMVRVGKGSRGNVDGTKVVVTGTDNLVDAATQYRYLGEMVTSAKGGGQKLLIEGLNRKIGAMKHLAGSSVDPTWAARALWMQAIKPSLLYGLETQSVNAATIKKINQAQNSIARWALGSSKRASEGALRAMLGLTTISGELMKRAVLWWCHVENMDDTRWPKLILQHMQNGTYYSKWWHDVQEAITILAIDPNAVKVSAAPEKIIKAAWMQWEKQQLDLVLSERSSLRCMSSSKVGKWDYQIDRCGWKKWITKLKIGDDKWKNDSRLCRLCGATISLLAIHVLIECTSPEVAELSARLTNWTGMSQQSIQTATEDQRISWVKSIIVEKCGVRVRLAAKVMRVWENRCDQK